ncbi:type III pantothenate kinase, partial [bacterium]|nr:type III pantothenate kinase [bacterium]
MLYLVFDLGNSRVKLARLAGDGFDLVTVLPVERFTADPAGALEPFGEVEGALGVSSHPQAYKILRGHLKRGGIEPVRARERCPLTVEYGEGLGDDRVLAAHAAIDLLGAPCAVVGCGTAVTVDLVRVRDQEPVFVGGAI